MATERHDDERFGEVRLVVDREAGLVEVSGDRIPTAGLHRDGPAGYPHAPIGTRDPDLLRLEIAGLAREIRPARGGLTRRSYRVDVRSDAVRHRLVPSTTDRSTLLRDGRPLGRMWAVPEVDVSAFWQPGAQVDPEDAALGYLLAAAFGTGAQPGIVTLIEVLFRF